MRGPRLVLVVAGAAVAMLVGLVVHGGVTPVDVELPAAGEVAVTVEASPSGVMPVAVRARAWLDGEVASFFRAVRTSLAVAVHPLASTMAFCAVAAWFVPRRDHRLGRVLPASPLAAPTCSPGAASP